MSNLFSDECRRDPFGIYAQLRSASPVLRVPPPFDAWMVFDYQGVKRVLNDHEAFSSAVPAPRNWFIFSDPPQHTKLRGLVSRAFTPRVIDNLKPRITTIARALLDARLQAGQMDMASDYAVPLAMAVIAELIGIPAEEGARFRGWSDVILTLSYTRSGGVDAEEAATDFRTVTEEMREYLARMIADRRATPREDLITRLVWAEIDGERLSHEEILGFMQLLIVAGQETTANLIDNAILCFTEHPSELQRLRDAPALLASAIEEVLRFRSPVQWMMRAPKRDVELAGQAIPAGALVLPMIGAANRDPNVFGDPERFDITRSPNPHIAFGHGIHSCIGAALSRMETRIALTEFLDRTESFELASQEPWEPRRALHVHGPSRLPIRFRAREYRATDGHV